MRFRNGVWYVGIRLKNRRWYERKLGQPTDGGAYDESYARLAAAALAREYANGWDPDAPVVAPVTGNPLALDYVTAWAERQTYETAPKDVRQVARYFARAAIAGLKVRDVKPRDAAAWIEWLKARRSKRGGTLSSSSVRNAFDVVQRAFDAAVFDELLPANPLHAARKRLPAKTDKHEGKREGWTFTREEIALLIRSKEIKPERRLRYALLLLTGMRFGESSALRWRDVDFDAEPLGRITVRRAIKSVSRKEGTTKTGARKLVPIHPALSPILEDWHANGWREALGRNPKPDDLVIPSVRGKRKGQPANSSAANRAFKDDQTALGMTPRHQHVARHAFISLAQDDGADGSVLRWVTHAPPASAFDGYSRAQWTRLCDEVAKLKVGTIVGQA